AALEARDRAEQAQQVAEQSSRAEQEVSRVLVELFESEDPQNRDPNVSALSLVQKGIARVQEHTSLALPTRIKLLGTLGLVLRNLGEYPQSVEVLKQAASLGEGERIPEKAEVYLNLGRVYESMGDLEAASEALEKASLLASDGDVSTKTAILNVQGIVAYYRGHLSDAISFYRQAQKLSAAALGPLHLDSLIPRINVAGLEGSQGNIDFAVPEVIQILNETRHLPVFAKLVCIQTLAGFLSFHPYKKASNAAMRWALEGNRKLFGEQHKRYLRIVLVSFHAFCRYGQLQRARELLDSVDIESIPDHYRKPVQAEFRLARGSLEFHCGNYKEALERLSAVSKCSDLLSPLPLDAFGYYAMGIWSCAEEGFVAKAKEWLDQLLLDMGYEVGE
ncbi:hypothetical protein AC249_AIPGENE22013, partial [Exaiptasia diaphana]